jgi:hypothetical protein
LTAALRPASEPAPAPLRGAIKSCGTKAESDRATDIAATKFCRGAENYGATRATIMQESAVESA